ncbi:hypothetical protein UA32_12435 [Photobacterium angustum]|uniref:Tyr recombinase domain-containing protein n=1 Tax=Photobacterium angustum TaxID=661 RepID=A0ABX5H1M6_PHOAN|nr:tyrosine-type recombinase/integrase [Photobacterium angustum]KJG37754.1 hypothetical protein UA32_12435 [Photobacterium angustum]PSX07021.1 hypothetical protein C0W27_15750 [Photobacterium angustum]
MLLTINDNVRALDAIKAKVNELSEFGDELRPSTVSKLMKVAVDNGVNLDDSEEIRQLIAVLLNNFTKRSDAYSQNTVKQLSYNWSNFTAYCTQHRVNSLPASAKTVEDYIRLVGTKYHRNTISSHLWAIGKMHVITGMSDPTKDSYVSLTRRSIFKNKVQAGEKINQANGFTADHLSEFIELYNKCTTLKQFRDKAMVTVAYECLLRSSELVNIKFSDLNIHKGESGFVNIPFSKTNKTGELDLRYLSEETVSLLFDYFDHANICFDDFSKDTDKCNRYIFVPCKKNGRLRDKPNDFGVNKLTRRTVNNLFLTVSQLLNVKFSAHSPRVGAVQDMFAENISLPLIQQAGGWGSANMPARYGSQMDIKHSAMAQMRNKK